MSLFDYLQKYVEVFGENFPVFGFMGISEDEIINTIKECLEKNKPYKLNVKKGIYY